MSRISLHRPAAGWGHALQGRPRASAASTGPEDPRAHHDAALKAFVRRAVAADPEGAAHPRRGGRISAMLARALGMGLAECAMIERAAALHDVGKALLPEGVLGRAHVLDREARRVMESHAALGAGILAFGDEGWLRLGATVALAHHERWDGSGYPAGLAGEAIPRAARIVAVADVYDALRSERAYKDAQEHGEALERLLGGDERISPAQFDPDVLEALSGIGPHLAAMAR